MWDNLSFWDKLLIVWYAPLLFFPVTLGTTVLIKNFIDSCRKPPR